MLCGDAMTTKKPSETEEEYFAKLDVEKKRKIVEKKRAKLAEEEVESLKQTHRMRCAGCGFELDPIVFKGVTINKCFHCGGAFLTNEAFGKLCGQDNRILEKILEIFGS